MIGTAGVVTLRQTSEVNACQNNLRSVHFDLNTYADAHNDHYPQVAAHQDVASTLVAARKTGAMSHLAAFTCPSVNHTSTGLTPIDYAYSLGYRDEEGHLKGIVREPENDNFPIAADAPERRDGMTVPINHRKGQNVLFGGGHVRFCTNPYVGPETGGKGDDIYYNTAREPRAGTHRRDIAARVRKRATVAAPMARLVTCDGESWPASVVSCGRLYGVPSLGVCQPYTSPRLNNPSSIFRNRLSYGHHVLMARDMDCSNARGGEPTLSGNSGERRGVSPPWNRNTAGLRRAARQNPLSAPAPVPPRG